MTHPRIVNCHHDKLDLTQHITHLRADVEEGREWVWYNQGMTKRLALDTLAEALRMYENATVNIHSRVRIPDRVRYIYWTPIRAARKSSRLPRRP